MDKLTRFKTSSHTGYGILDGDTIYETASLLSTDRGRPHPLRTAKLLVPCQPTKIVCVGRNYRDHAKELGNDVPAEPLIFLKPESAVLTDNRDFIHPDFSQEIHFECEIVYRICEDCKLVDRQSAHHYYDGIGLGIDFTARDLQDEIKKKGHPWTLAKMFDDSAPISQFIDPKELPAHDNLHFQLRVNDVVRQTGFSGNMLFPIDVLIAYISQFITLKKGDLIFTGTPEGVGKVNVGDRLQASLEGKDLLDFYVK